MSRLFGPGARLRLIGIKRWHIVLQDSLTFTLDVVELVMSLEEEFGIEVDDEDAEKLLYVKDVVDYVVRRTAK